MNRLPNRTAPSDHQNISDGGSSVKQNEDGMFLATSVSPYMTGTSATQASKTRNNQVTGSSMIDPSEAYTTGEQLKPSG